MKWGYEGIHQNGTIKICPENGIDLDNYIFEVPTFDDAFRACNEHNKTEEKAVEAEKLLRKVISITKWKNGNNYTECIVDDKIIAKIKEFLGDDQG